MKRDCSKIAQVNRTGIVMLHKIALLSTIIVLSLGATALSWSDLGAPVVIECDELQVAASPDGHFRLDQIPAEIRKLEGRKVRMRAYISPFLTGKETDPREFLMISETSGPTYKLNSPEFPSHGMLKVRLDSNLDRTQLLTPRILEGTLRFQQFPYGDNSKGLFVIENATLCPTEHIEGKHPIWNIFGC